MIAERRQRWGALRVRNGAMPGDAGQQLGELRAALALTLRLVRRDPDGGLVVPSDTEIMAEIHRLMASAQD
jgi:hypothetical protein